MAIASVLQMGKLRHREGKIILKQKNIAVKDWFLVSSYTFSYTHPSLYQNT